MAKVWLCLIRNYAKNTWVSGEAVPRICSLGSSRGARVTPCHFTPEERALGTYWSWGEWVPETVSTLPGNISWNPSHPTQSASTTLAELTPLKQQQQKYLNKKQQIKNIVTSRKSPACYPQAKLRFTLVHYLVRVSREFGFDNIKIVVPVVFGRQVGVMISWLPTVHKCLCSTPHFFLICVIYLWTIVIE